jgi:DNA-binding MarR family transcriptional regulator
VVADRLRLAMGRMVRRIRRETDGRQSPSAISALATIRRLGTPTLGEVAEAEGVSRPSLTVQAAALERQGLISREVSGSDRRLVQVKVTAKGARVLQASRSRRTAYLSRQLEMLDTEDLDVLERAAEILERLLEEGG